MSSFRQLTLSALLTLAFAASASAETPGVTSDRIVFGQAAALEGPTSALGQGMNQGLLAAFNEINSAGGVHGRKLELVAVDDGYEPEKSVAAVTRLINEDKVFALIGAVGTPTSKATQPIATQAGVPFIGPFTGAGFLRDAALTNVVNVRASYGQETEAWIERLTKDLGIKKIAILYQDDAYGEAGLAGVKKALEKRGMSLVAEGKYERNTTAVKSALLEIRKAEPEAVVMVGAYKPCAEFIKLARKVKLNSVFVNISFVGSNALAKELGADGAGVIVSQVVPLPQDTSIPLVASYQAALKALDPAAEPGFVSLEGYAVGRLIIAALEQIQDEPTRESLLKAIGSGSFDLQGMKLAFGAGDNQGSDDVFFTVIQADGTFKSVQQLSAGS
jgi:branched-chain amino acid transport system substrate-binding protein